MREDLEGLIALANETFGVDIKSNTRGRKTVWVRNIYYHAARRLTSSSLTQIGRASGRSHATVIHGIRMYDIMLNDPEFKRMAQKFAEAAGKISTYKMPNEAIHLYGIRIKDNWMNMFWHTSTSKGVYSIVAREDGEIEAYSNGLDKDYDKRFGSRLMQLIVEKMKVVE